MTPTSVRDIRNLSLLGQSGSGKTTLLEKLLVTAGAIGAAGSVEKGDTVSDYDAQEKAIGHSLNSSLAHLEWAEHWINILDTPGLPDFLGRALATLPAVETAAVVINASSGVETVTRKIMDTATDKCRMIVVNRIDAPGVDFGALMERITATFGKECLPINLPTAGGAAVIDCFFKPDYDAQPAFSSVREAHDRIVDQVVEVDEELMALYLEQGESLQPEQLHDPFEQSLREGHLIPVCFTSARTGAGITELLDIMGRLLPDPTEGNPPQFLKGEGPAAQAVSATTDADQHVIKIGGSGVGTTDRTLDGIGLAAASEVLAHGIAIAPGDSFAASAACSACPRSMDSTNCCRDASGGTGMPSGVISSMHSSAPQSSQTL
mgnify:CR=1 FL=1